MSDQTSGPTSSSIIEKRVRQLEILAGLGVKALQRVDFNVLLDDAARLTAEGMRTEFCKILEHKPGERCFLVRAGVGWEPGVVGAAVVADDIASPAGYALRTGLPVVSDLLDKEERFRTPELLMRHGIRRAMNVILQGEGRPYGVLEVDSPSEVEFDARDTAFLQGTANILGMAIEHERYERTLKDALEYQQVLLKEITHRVKNSLAVVAGMLHLQANSVDDPQLTTQLEEAAARVSAVAKVHEHIQQAIAPDRLDLGTYITDVCRDLNQSLPHHRIELSAELGIEITTDRAVPIALLVNELVTNASKYAYEGSQSGKIWVRMARGANDTIELSVRDEGRGLPENFDLASTQGLGMRITRGLTQQLRAAITAHRLEPGSQFTVIIPS